MYRLLFHRFGITAFQSVKPDVSLIIVSFWRLFVVAISPRNRSIDIVFCDGANQ